MFGGNWKQEVELRLKELENSLQEVKKSEIELKSKNAQLMQIIKNLGKKLVMRFPVSMESLDKALTYDLIFAEEAEAWSKATGQGVIIDIRNTDDFVKGSVSGAINIPYENLALRMDGLNRNQPILIVCDNGVKSVSACEMLTDKGFAFVYVMRGGMEAVTALKNPAKDAEELTAAVV